MKVTGKKISNTAKELRRGQMVLSMMEHTSTERSMEQVDSPGLMEVHTLVILKTIIFKDMEPTIGLTVECLLAHG